VLDTAAPRVLPEAPVADALALLDAEGGDRLPVVAAGGELVGLVCLNRRHGHFCAD
jgi:CBS domain-containing protein